MIERVVIDERREMVPGGGVVWGKQSTENPIGTGVRKDIDTPIHRCFQARGVSLGGSGCARPGKGQLNTQARQKPGASTSKTTERNRH